MLIPASSVPAESLITTAYDVFAESVEPVGAVNVATESLVIVVGLTRTYNRSFGRLLALVE